MIRVWLWPVVIGLLSACGLAAGLVSDGVGDVVAWIGLGVPVGIAARCSLRGRAPSKPGVLGKAGSRSRA